MDHGKGMYSVKQFIMTLLDFLFLGDLRCTSIKWGGLKSNHGSRQRSARSSYLDLPTITPFARTPRDCLNFMVTRPISHPSGPHTLHCRTYQSTFAPKKHAAFPTNGQSQTPSSQTQGDRDCRSINRASASCDVCKGDLEEVQVQPSAWRYFPRRSVCMTGAS
ncbi:hypothetical protein BDW59DRAFT_27514 [Aspergillus cavernicola]|uniref:Uncharacterized protein n=1 Tax=Aspergillus cavernicola TaxID=176166 RepID=A0ABR4HEL2_9EURO